jgi:hypothetical protein
LNNGIKQQMLSTKMKFSFGYGVVAIFFAYIVYTQMGHDREVASLGVLLFKLLPFVFGALAIATLDIELIAKGRFNLFFLYLGFLVFFGLFVPRIFWEGFENESGGLYYIVLILVPYIILLLGFAFRLGGGSTTATLRLLFALLLIMLSGIEDLAYLVTTPGQGPIPEVWHWASHIKVRIGHYPTKYEAYAFITVHFILAAIVTLYSFRPFNRLSVLLGRSA